MTGFFAFLQQLSFVARKSTKKVASTGRKNDSR
jgi:hypothetical protein